MPPDKVKIGDVIEISLLPCEECGDRHARTVIALNPEMASWASDGGKGHVLKEVKWQSHVQDQRDLINRLLAGRRRLQSKIYKLEKKNAPR